MRAVPKGTTTKLPGPVQHNTSTTQHPSVELPPGLTPTRNIPLPAPALPAKIQRHPVPHLASPQVLTPLISPTMPSQPSTTAPLPAQRPYTSPHGHPTIVPIVKIEPSGTFPSAVSPPLEGQVWPPGPTPLQPQQLPSLELATSSHIPTAATQSDPHTPLHIPRASNGSITPVAAQHSAPPVSHPCPQPATSPPAAAAAAAAAPTVDASPSTDQLTAAAVTPVGPGMQRRHAAAEAATEAPAADPGATARCGTKRAAEGAAGASAAAPAAKALRPDASPPQQAAVIRGPGFAAAGVAAAGEVALAEPHGTAGRAAPRPGQSPNGMAPEQPDPGPGRAQPPRAVATSPSVDPVAQEEPAEAATATVADGAAAAQAEAAAQRPANTAATGDTCVKASVGEIRGPGWATSPPVATSSSDDSMHAPGAPVPTSAPAEAPGAASGDRARSGPRLDNGEAASRRSAPAPYEGATPVDVGMRPLSGVPRAATATPLGAGAGDGMDEAMADPVHVAARVARAVPAGSTVLAGDALTRHFPGAAPATPAGDAMPSAHACASAEGGAVQVSPVGGARSAGQAGGGVRLPGGHERGGGGSLGGAPAGSAPSSGGGGGGGDDVFMLPLLQARREGGLWLGPGEIVEFNARVRANLAALRREHAADCQYLEGLLMAEAARGREVEAALERLRAAGAGPGAGPAWL